MSSSNNTAVEQMIERFDRRAARRRWSANVIICVIVLILILGIGLFLRAGELASSEANSTVLQALNDKKTLAQNRIDDLRNSLDVVQKEIKIRSGMIDAELTRGGTPRPLLVTDLKQQRTDLQKKEEAIAVSLDTWFKQFSSLEDSAAMEGATPLDARNRIPIVLSALATRAGSIVVLLFLVRILAPIYRYHVRLASYYDARADALRLISIDGSPGETIGLEKLAAILSPESVDFGAAPSSPVEQALDLTKNLLSSRKD